MKRLFLIPWILFSTLHISAQPGWGRGGPEHLFQFSFSIYDSLSKPLDENSYEVFFTEWDGQDGIIESVTKQGNHFTVNLRDWPSFTYLPSFEALLTDNDKQQKNKEPEKQKPQQGTYLTLGIRYQKKVQYIKSAYGIDHLVFKQGSFMIPQERFCILYFEEDGIHLNNNVMEMFREINIQTTPDMKKKPFLYSHSIYEDKYEQIHELKKNASIEMMGLPFAHDQSILFYDYNASTKLIHLNWNKKSGMDTLTVPVPGNFWIREFIACKNKNIYGFYTDYRYETGNLHVMVSGNLGYTWQKDSLLSTINAYNIYFRDSLTGFCIGEIRPGRDDLYKTTDGGKTWKNIHTTYTDMDYKLFFFSNDSVGFIQSYHPYEDVYYRTTDGGHSWCPYEVMEKGFDPATDVFVGKTQIFTDRQELYRPLNSVRQIGFLKYFDASRGIIVNSNYLLLTNNGGVTWDFFFMNDIGSLVFDSQDPGTFIGQDIQFIDRDHLVVMSSWSCTEIELPK